MCHPATGPWTYKLGLFFKDIEWLFWVWLFWVAFSLLNPREKFKNGMNFCNWLIKIHDFDGKIIITEKSYQRFHRDLWILLFLVGIILVLIKFI